MFAIFGVTEQIVDNEARKHMSSYLAEGNKRPTTSQWKQEYARITEKLKKSVKPKQLSGEFSTPELAQEFMKMAKATGWTNKLSLKIKEVKRLPNGDIETTATGKPKGTWKPYSEVANKLQKDAA